MSTIFPLREKVRLDDGREPRLVDLDDEVADDVFQALSSGTTRRIFATLQETPQTASDLAEVTSTSVQNV
jgi:DNA-binding transcriptional ArsR family regulator